MRLLRRNALGIYAVYGAAIVSGLVVTPIVIHSIGTTGIRCLVVHRRHHDLPLAARLRCRARRSCGSRPRRGAAGPTDDLNALASTGLAIYAAIGAATLPLGAAIAWLVPWASGTPHHLVWDARVATLLVVLSLAARFPLGLFNNLLVAQQRWDLQNLGELRLDRALRARSSRCSCRATAGSCCSAR